MPYSYLFVHISSQKQRWWNWGHIFWDSHDLTYHFMDSSILPFINSKRPLKKRNHTPWGYNWKHRKEIFILSAADLETLEANQSITKEITNTLQAQQNVNTANYNEVQNCTCTLNFEFTHEEAHTVCTHEKNLLWLNQHVLALICEVFTRCSQPAGHLDCFQESGLPLYIKLAAVTFNIGTT